MTVEERTIYEKEKKAAEQYAKEKRISINKLRYIHGSTQLYYAFMAGIEWQKQNSKKSKPIT